MITNDIFSDVRSLMDYAGVTYAELGLILGSSRQSIYGVLKNGVLSRQMLDIIEILGYKVEYCFIRGRESYSFRDVSEGIRFLMQKEGLSFTALGERVDCARNNTHRIVSAGLLTPRLLGMLEAMGYDVELRYVRNIKCE